MSCSKPNSSCVFVHLLLQSSVFPVSLLWKPPAWKNIGVLTHNCEIRIKNYLQLFLIMNIMWKFTISHVITAMWIFVSYMRCQQPWNHHSYMWNFKNKTVVIDSIFIIMDPFAVSYLSCIGNDKAEKSTWWFLFISVPGPLIMTGSFSTQKEGKLLLLQICSLNQTDAFIQKIFASVWMFFLMYFFLSVLVNA